MLLTCEQFQYNYALIDQYRLVVRFEVDVELANVDYV